MIYPFPPEYILSNIINISDQLDEHCFHNNFREHNGPTIYHNSFSPKCIISPFLSINIISYNSNFPHNISHSQCSRTIPLMNPSSPTDLPSSPTSHPFYSNNNLRPPAVLNRCHDRLRRVNKSRADGVTQFNMRAVHHAIDSQLDKAFETGLVLSRCRHS